MLDMVTAPAVNSASGESFQHEVGEVEATMDYSETAESSDRAAVRERLCEQMREELCEFMGQYVGMFPPATKGGKLGAYLAWKGAQSKGVARRG